MVRAQVGLPTFIGATALVYQVVRCEAEARRRKAHIGGRGVMGQNAAGTSPVVRPTW